MTEINPSSTGPAKSCCCPYCEHEEPLPFPFCASCGKPVSHCAECEAAIPADAARCPTCGAPIQPAKG